MAQGASGPFPGSIGTGRGRWRRHLTIAVLAVGAAGRLEGGRPGEGDEGDAVEEPRRGSSPPKDGPRANDVRRRVRIMPRR